MRQVNYFFLFLGKYKALLLQKYFRGRVGGSRCLCPPPGTLVVEGLELPAWSCVYRPQGASKANVAAAGWDSTE